MHKGFTLIELLVTIAIMAVVAAAVLSAINPQQKIFAAYDSAAQAGIGQIATALQSYATQNNAAYPATLAAMVTAGELKSLPAFPSGVTSWNYQISGGAVAIYANMQATKNSTQGAVYCWKSSSGLASFTTVALCVP